MEIIQYWQLVMWILHMIQYNDPSSTYIRIADGWSSTADRYVWGSCYGTWNYVSVIVY